MATIPIVPNPYPAMQGSGANGNIPSLAPIGGGHAVGPAIPGATTPAAPSALNPAATNPAIPIGTNTGINWNDGDYTVLGDFKDTYGAGTGTGIVDVLKNLGTSTDAAVQATAAEVNREAGIQLGNIQANEAASGITPNSSAAALAESNFQTGVNTSLQSTIANMENQQEDTLLAALLGEGQAHGGDVSGWETLGNVLSGNESAIGALANAANATSASGTGTFSEILTALGALA